MSVNWVMLSDNEGFIPLAGERRLHTCPPRVALSLQSLNKYPGREPFATSSASGRLYLTNKRVVYLPDSKTPRLQSFAAPILNLHDTHVTAPFFGPNVWVAVCQPVPNGGIPSHHAAVELKLTFKDGGAYDFHNKYLQVKERMQQAVDVARESDDGRRRVSRQGGNTVDLDNVHLDQLPAYEESASNGSQTVQQTASEPAPIPTPTAVLQDTSATSSAVDRQSYQPPAEPPPGYEETQRDSVAESLERSLRVRDT